MEFLQGSLKIVSISIKALLPQNASLEFTSLLLGRFKLLKPEILIHLFPSGISLILLAYHIH